MAVGLDLARQHLRVTHHYEDGLIAVYLAAAKAFVASYIGKHPDGVEGDHADLDAAVLLLVADLDENRESGGASPATSAAVQALCWPHREMLGGSDPA